MSYSGSELNPLFHSEISSTHLFYDIFNRHKGITASLIVDYFGEHPEQIVVFREKSYPKKGSIDIFIEFVAKGRKCALLIEAKVHDYLSVTDNQISTYYQAVLEDLYYDEVYFIYLTQFNEQINFDNIAQPRSLMEGANGRDQIGDRFRHLTWGDLHSFMSGHNAGLNREQKMMLEMHLSWIEDKNRVDLENNKVESGERSLEDYFRNSSEAIDKLIDLGEQFNHDKRLKLRLDLDKLDNSQLDTILDAIKLLSQSESVNSKKVYATSEQTLEAVANFLSELSLSYKWGLLRFFSGLFNYANEKRCLRIHGTGSRGFSIRVDVIDMGEISLCTLYGSKSIHFSLKR
jgi:hypothetical protein